MSKMRKNDTKRRAELANFLKIRRARLHPEQFGLPSFGRRRTPGLRRDEVAQLAGVGVSWYTWLEQGRDITVSDQVIERLAETFLLNGEERRHLFVLALGMVPIPDEQFEIAVLPPGLQAMLDALGTNPAYLIDQRCNVVAWNQSASHVFGDVSLLTGRERNRIWQLFVQPASRQLYVDWEQAARHAVMHFRSVYDRYIGDAWFEQFLTNIQRESPEFRTLWAQHDVQAACDFYQEKELNHPLVGQLLLSSTTLIVPVAPPLQMVTFTPSSPATATKLAALAKPERQTSLTR
ncbi:helix-turn-helix transcriptional regulator [Dictyobacter arantiisoli]|uniref:Transcriptional regulator n=1 Tax=Dictyobacter arantiisoli TaxID=2014874 RepID=A0A5A5TIU6_9CHLR|nr:helix-turn-helix transcriptional regulator [Dictyobacter arantiisoli]GCF11530.1 transcriptional regulator [Dictyobacter arantiisoli]